MSDEYRPPHRSWPRKFRDAFRALWLVIRGESSFHVHLVFAVLAIAAAIVLQVSRTDWCILLLCITIVFAAEVFNTALEHLAKAIDRSENRHIRSALDMGSAAVLVAAIGAVIIGCVVFTMRIVSWWQDAV